jgi:hypothetical protein
VLPDSRYLPETGESRLTSGNDEFRLVDNRCCPTGDNFLYDFKGARSAPRATARLPHVSWRALAGDTTAGAALGGAGAKRPRDSHRNRAGSPALDLRRTAGCRPSATPGTARHRLTAITPADRASREKRPSSRRPQS